MNNVRITYIPRPDTKPQSELDALASIYRFVFDCQAMKKDTRPSAPDARKEDLNVSGKPILQEDP